MRNIFFSYEFFPKIGGAHLWLYNVAKNWPEHTKIITSAYPSLLNEQKSFDIRNHGSVLKILRLPFKVTSWGIDLQFLRNLFILFEYFRSLSLKENQCICIHALKSIPESACVFFLKNLLQRKIKIKLITYAHGEEFLVADTSRHLKLLTKLALGSSDLIIANSHSTKKLASKFVEQSKIKVVHLGVDFDKFQKHYMEREVLRKKWGLTDEVIVLVTISRMEPRKNHLAVIKATSDLRDEGLPLAYVIGGVGEEEKRLKQFVHKKGLERWIKFLGCVSEEEKIKTFCASDIHIMPSIKVGPMIEGFGIVFMEAAAAGIPSIAGNVGGQPEAVIHNKTGLVVDGTDAKAIKKAIRELAMNPSRRLEMGSRAREWAKQHKWVSISRKISDSLEQ